MNFAIIGASGNVGRKTIEILEKSKITIDNLFLVASSKSVGKKIKFKNKEIEIEDLENYNFSRAQITFFAAGSKVAKEWVPKAAKETISYQYKLAEEDDSKLIDMIKNENVQIYEMTINEKNNFLKKVKPFHNNFFLQFPKMNFNELI